MAQEIYRGDKRLNFTATTTLPNGGNLSGVIVASSTAGSIKIADTFGTIVNTMAVTAGQYYTIECKWVGTLTITVTGTLDATLFYKL